LPVCGLKPFFSLFDAKCIFDGWQLQKIYERKARKKLSADAAGSKIPDPDKMKSPDKSKLGLSDYEKNR
jgi:hypothetical protein